MNEDRFWLLLAKKLSGETDEQELDELNKFISENPDYQFLSNYITEFWNLRKGNNRYQDLALAKRIWNRTMGKNQGDFPAKRPAKKAFLPRINFNLLKNYIKIGLRNLQRQKGLAFINVFGLAVAIACVCLIALFVNNELNFDKFHKNAANIYRAYEWDELNGGKTPIGYTDIAGKSAATLGEAMKSELPDVVQYVRFQLPAGESIIKTESGVYRLNISFTDPSFFSVFTFPLTYGNSATVLTHPYDVVLTESTALQLFGYENAVGQSLSIKMKTGYRTFRVAGIARDIPNNSTIQFDLLGNFQFAQEHKDDLLAGSNWHPTVQQTYVLLKKGSRLNTESNRLANFIQKYNPDFVAHTRNYVQNMKEHDVEWKGPGLPVSFRFQPLVSIHTDTRFNAWGFIDYKKLNPAILWILLGIAGGILLIACINFTTLATGRLSGRGKEVGIRKIMGAERRQVLTQFLIETLILVLLSAVIGVIMAKLLLPLFNFQAGRQLEFPMLLNFSLITLLAAVLLAAALLAGLYPSLVLSGFKPIEALKNRLRIKGSNWFTKSLVTLQFGISFALIFATVVILKQTHYMIGKDPGFDRENVIAIDAGQSQPAKIFPLFRNILLNNPNISGIGSAVAGIGADDNFLGYSDGDLSADVNIIDTNYIHVMGMQLVAGANLKSSPFDSLQKPVIINETMMKHFGWNKYDAIGKEISNFQGRTAVVAGVVRNFNYRPLKEDIRNQLFETTSDAGYRYFYVRIKPGAPAQALKKIDEAWHQVAPGIPLKYSFLDEDLKRYYQTEEKWTSIIAWAGSISIMLACLGILGLAILAAMNRTKEIGVRKVLGASVPDIVGLLTGNLIKLILLAEIVSAPFAYTLMSKWLENYANRVSIGWGVLLISGSGILILAALTVGFHTIKAALTNPAKSLRTE